MAAPISGLLVTQFLISFLIRPIAFGSGPAFIIHAVFCRLQTFAAACKTVGLPCYLVEVFDTLFDQSERLSAQSI